VEHSRVLRWNYSAWHCDFIIQVSEFIEDTVTSVAPKVNLHWYVRASSLNTAKVSL
jgi:hypothetical protein